MPGVWDKKLSNTKIQEGFYYRLYYRTWNRIADYTTWKSECWVHGVIDTSNLANGSIQQGRFGSSQANFSDYNILQVFHRFCRPVLSRVHERRPLCMDGAGCRCLDDKYLGDVCIQIVPWLDMYSIIGSISWLIAVLMGLFVRGVDWVAWVMVPPYQA